MGRRKIEIQPITHERNRSVTFLKRKNGLFKKAYELGVLCSVDVAVIVFDERPGHHVKLFQYCSTDVQSMVQRHIRHDGESDTRGPADFAPGAQTKIEDPDLDLAEEDDEDEDVGNGGQHPRGSMKRRNEALHIDTNYLSSPRSMGSSHSFPPNPAAASMIQRQQGYSQRSSQQQQHIPQRHYEQDSSTNNPQLQFGLDTRHQMSPTQTKRPRLGLGGGVDSSSHSHLPSMGSPYTSTATNTGTGTPQFRVPGHLSMQQQQQQQSPYDEYTSFGTSPPTSNPQKYGSLQVGGVSRSRAASGSEHHHPHHHPHHLQQPQHRPISSHGIPGARTIYGSMGPSPATAGTTGFLGISGSGGDDTRRRSAASSGATNTSATQAASGLGLDWPLTKPPPPPPPPSSQQHERDPSRRGDIEGERAAAGASGSGGGSANPGSAGTSSATSASGIWLDFLSGNNGNESTTTNVPNVSGSSHGSGTSPSGGGGGGGGLSWERGIPPPGPSSHGHGRSGSAGDGVSEIDSLSLFGLSTGPPDTKKESA